MAFINGVAGERFAVRNSGALIKKLELNPEYEIAKYALPESDEHLSCTIGDLFAGLQLKFW